MLPMLRCELVERRGWLTDRELVDYYAIGQSTPGVIAVNTATFAGYKRAGVLGALSATVGMVLPSLVIIMLVAAFFARFEEFPVVQRALRGVRVAVSMILIFTVISLVRKTVVNRWGVLLAIAAFAAIVIVHISPIPVVLGAGVAGFLGGTMKGGS